jgi:hypothetical protein
MRRHQAIDLLDEQLTKEFKKQDSLFQRAEKTKEHVETSIEEDVLVPEIYRADGEQSPSTPPREP